MNKLRLATLVAASSVALASCGGSDESEKRGKAENAGKSEVGYFGNNIENLTYRVFAEPKLRGDGTLDYEDSLHVFTGKTGRQGQFYYNKGDTVAFYIGDIEVGSAKAEKFVSVASFDDAITAVGGVIPNALGFTEFDCSPWAENQVRDPEAEAPEGEAPEDEQSEDGQAEEGETVISETDSDETPSEPKPPQCEESFPEEGYTLHTKLVYTALNELNEDLDSEMMDNMYVSDDQDMVASHYFDTHNEPADLNYLALLSRHALKPKEGTYSVSFGTKEGCFEGPMKVSLKYAETETDSGVLFIESIEAENPDGMDYEVHGFSERTREINPEFEFEGLSRAFNYPLNLKLRLDEDGYMVGSYTEEGGLCTGSEI